MPTMIRRAFWRVASRLGPTARRWMWDDQFRRGAWDRIEAKSPLTVGLIVKYARGGAVLELGCGTGQIAKQLPEKACSRYLGIDMSEEAIKRANDNKPEGSLFHVAAMEGYKPLGPYAVIVMEECLYYLAPAAQRELLAACMDSLAPGGVILVVIGDPKGKAATVQTALEAGRLVERIDTMRAYLVIGR